MAIMHFPESNLEISLQFRVCFKIALPPLVLDCNRFSFTNQWNPVFELLVKAWHGDLFIYSKDSRLSVGDFSKTLDDSVTGLAVHIEVGLFLCSRFGDISALFSLRLGQLMQRTRTEPAFLGNHKYFLSGRVIFAWLSPSKVQ
jgi:hypothetical protein